MVSFDWNLTTDTTSSLLQVLPVRKAVQDQDYKCEVMITLGNSPRRFTFFNFVDGVCHLKTFRQNVVFLKTFGFLLRRVLAIEALSSQLISSARGSIIVALILKLLEKSHTRQH